MAEQNTLFNKTIVLILKDLYAHGIEHHNQIFEALKNKRLNPVLNQTLEEREDIQYYIPQLITYLAFQIDLRDEDFIDFILKGCELHYMFSHSCYFYLSSISTINGINIPEVQQFLRFRFLSRMAHYSDVKLTGGELAKCTNIVKQTKKQPTPEERDAWEKYGTMEADEIRVKTVTTVQIPNFGTANGYMSQIAFWEQLIRIGNDLSFCNPKRVGLMKQLREVNKSLPAAAYIPFVKENLRHYTILNINVQNARVFSTKQRSPYSIYIEVFREEEQFMEVEPVIRTQTEDEAEEERSNNQIMLEKSAATKKSKLDTILSTLNKQLSKPLTIFKNQNSLKLAKKPVTVLSQLVATETKQEQAVPHRGSEGEQGHILSRAQHSSVIEEVIRARRLTAQPPRATCQESGQSGSSLSESNQNEEGLRSSEGYLESNQVNRTSQPDQHTSSLHKNSIKLEMSHGPEKFSQEEEQRYVDQFFDEPFASVTQRIRQKSIYKDFKTWRLVNIMVKTGDNLKQEQFAMQLINQFNIIFHRQGTGLILRPYEVISMGPDSGILQMVTDTSSLGRIIKNMGKEEIPTLKQFFKSYFKGNYKTAQRNFCRSLAAYSLVTYFLQVKDRHNDNILLHREGYIVHIDFGFFLSNAPGGGIELQKACPFKLMSNYMEVLGGPNSLLFMEFRSLFEKGFRAAVKHQDEIITLVKMMYSSHGESMPCFIKGQTAIDELESRFSPDTEDITEHCQELINRSLDNWRARWYDKFQYWLQGIFY